MDARQALRKALGRDAPGLIFGGLCWPRRGAGRTFSRTSALPPAFADAAFVVEHGSWNRTFSDGYKVVYAPFENGRPASPARDVVTGFIKGDGAHGRPVGVGIDGTGALLVADDAGNTVWRVANADGSVLPQPIGTDQAAPGAPTPSQTDLAPAGLPAGASARRPRPPRIRLTSRRSRRRRRGRGR